MNITRIDRLAIPAIIALSVIIPIAVLVLMYMPERYNLMGTNSGTFPLFHAILNGLTAILLIVGYFLMRVREYLWHKNVMIMAFFLSSVFLVSYVLSKISNDPVPYGGEGFMRYVYFFVLITHIVLSAVIVPMVLFTMYRGLKADNARHSAIAKYTFPVWLYVTVTGVLVYIFMFPYY